MAARALIVGAGGMGKAWGRNLLANDETEIAGWVDIRPGAAAAALEELGVAKAWGGEDLKQALSEVRPDFVVDVTVPESHCEVTVASLEAGVPVLGEKPMAASMEEARRMVAASEKAGKLYMVSQSRRYDGRLTAYRKLVEKLGPLGILNADFYIGAHFGGFRDEMPSPLVLDMAIHTFDQARKISGTDPESVYAEEFNPSWSWYRGDVSANCLFTMLGGCRFTYRGSWCAEGLMTSWEAEWRAVGPNGTAKWDGHGSIQADFVVGTEGFQRECRREEAEPDSIASGIEGSLREFLHALRTGETPQGECHDNIKSLAMVFAAIESAATATRIPIAPLMD